MPVVRRSSRLIDSKRILGVDRIVGGSSCDAARIDVKSLEHHQPHNSFDERGFLLQRAFLAKDQQGSAQAESSSSARIMDPAQQPTSDDRDQDDDQEEQECAEQQQQQHQKPAEQRSFAGVGRAAFVKQVMLRLWPTIFEECISRMLVEEARQAVRNARASASAQRITAQLLQQVIRSAMVHFLKIRLKIHPKPA